MSRSGDLTLRRTTRRAARDAGKEPGRGAFPGRRRLPCIMALWLLLSWAPAARADGFDFAVDHGHFFKQANGAGGAGATGYAVRDDQFANFWSEFQRLGGVAMLGYPVSGRFLWDGFLVQAFQKVVLQWRPERQQTDFVNVFDRLAAAGKDPWLAADRQTPPSSSNAADAGLSWDAIVTRHLALLGGDPAIQAAYTADADPIAHFGLPMGAQDYGPVFVVRAQRAVFQHWKVDVPWAKAGQVVVANGGDVAKEAGLYPELATMPQANAGTPSVQALLIGSGTPGRLYALVPQGLLVSDDAAATWRPFPGGLPVPLTCVSDLTLDYARHDALYASTCQGLYRWDGGRWALVSSQQIWAVAVAVGTPATLLASASWSPGAPPTVARSDDGGQTWQDLGPDHAPGNVETVAFDPRAASVAYALVAYRSVWFTLYRGTTQPGQWSPIPQPFPSLYIQGMTLDGASGAMYLAAQNQDQPAPPLEPLIFSPHQIWRSPNPAAPNTQDVRWELVHDFGENVNARLLASGAGPQGPVLYANLSLATEPGHFVPVLYRSRDAGQTWEALPAPSA